MDKRIQKILTQNKIPVIYNDKINATWIKTPYEEDNHYWLKNGKKSEYPKWDRENQKWDIPKSWFNDTVNKSLERWRRIYIIQPHNTLEKCAPACLKAKGHECQCSCMGQNHGSQDCSGWTIIGEAFAYRFDNKELACRLLEKN